MQASVVLGDLTNPVNIKKLQQILEELYDLHDPLYTETAPNGSISSHRGRLAIYKNGAVYEQWQNVDGDTLWRQMDANAITADMAYADSRYKVGATTYDLSTASGTMSITGAGFTPKCFDFLTDCEANDTFSIGFDDGVTPSSLVRNADGAIEGQPYSLYYQNGANVVTGIISAFTADGCTITWTKTGTPTGTLVIKWKACR